MKKSPLKEILDQIAEQQVMIDRDISGYNPATRIALETAKNQALQAKNRLTAEYMAAVRRGIYLVILRGEEEKVQEMARLAREDEQIVIDVGEPYRDIAGLVDAKMGPDRRFGPAQMIDANDRLSDWTDRLGIFAYPGPTMDSAYYYTQAKTLADTTALTTDIVWRMLGIKLIEQILEEAIPRKALEQEHSLAVLPVFIYGVPEGREAEIGQRCFAGHYQVVPFNDDDHALQPSETFLKTIYAEIKRYMIEVLKAK